MAESGDFEQVLKEKKISLKFKINLDHTSLLLLRQMDKLRLIG